MILDKSRLPNSDEPNVTPLNQYEEAGPSTTRISEKQPITHKVAGLLKAARIHTATWILLVIFIPIYEGSQSVLYSLGISLPLMLAAMGGFCLNDYFDLVKDVINKPHRAYPRALVTGFDLVAFGTFLLLSSITLAFLVFDRADLILLTIAACIGVISYNIIVKKAVILKNIYTALLCVFPIILVLEINNLESIYYLLVPAGMLIIISRELLMDIIDVPGDSRVGLITFPIKFGVPIAIKLSILLQVTSLIMLLLLTILSFTYIKLIGLIVISVTISLSWLSWFNLFGSIGLHLRTDARLIAIMILIIPLITSIIYLV